MKFSDFKDFGAMLAIENATPEPTVDATYRKITAFNQTGEVNKMTVDTVNNEITIATTGTYKLTGTAKFSGSNKNFDIKLFKNGVNTTFGMEDYSDGNAAISSTIALVAGDVLDARQASTDGGVALTVHTMAITLERLI